MIRKAIVLKLMTATASGLAFVASVIVNVNSALYVYSGDVPDELLK